MEAERIREQFKDAIEKQAGMQATERAEKNTVERDGVEYSKDLSFKEQVDAVVGGKDTTSTHLKISEHTPKFLIDLGLNDKPMLITSAHTKTALGIPVKNKNVHAVEKNTMYDLLSLMENPVIAIESKKPGSIVLFINAVDANKAPVLCSIKIDGQGFYNSVEVQSNVVTSVYGKDTNPVGFIENAVNDNRLLYWDKEKSQKLFAIPGLQLPNNINNFDSNIIIRKIKRNVNRNSRDVFTKADEDYMNAVESGDMKSAQMMVDEAAKKAGYAVKGYHGTGADFNIFSEDKVGGRNVWGKGFYFGTSKGIADDYASYRESKGGKYRIVSASLKMDSPFTPHKSSLGTAEEILDRWFPDMWQNSRELGIGYVKEKLENSPLDLLQFIAEHNNVEVKDVLAEYGFDSVKDGGELVVFNANQIKPSDPVTYDDNGDIIPLSERFNTEKKDIRWSKDLSSEEIRSDDEITTGKEEQRARAREWSLKRWGADIGRTEDIPSMSIERAMKKIKGVLSHSQKVIQC